MSDKKQIDRLFQEKFKDFEVHPDDQVWNRISESLPKKKKKRKVLPLWWQIAGVAAAIVLLFTVGITIFNSEDGSDEQLPVVNSEVKYKNKSSDYDNANENQAAEYLKNNNSSNNVVVETDSIDDLKIKSNEVGNSIITQFPKANRKSKSSQSTVIANQSTNKQKPLSNNKTNDLIKITSENKANRTVANSTDNVSIPTSKDGLKTNGELKSVIATSVKDNSTAVTETHSEKVNDTKNKNNTNTDLNSIESAQTNETMPEEFNTLTIEEAIAEQTNTTNEKEKVNERDRWSISPNVAPVYFSSLGQGSPINEQFNNNAKGGDVNMSYGIAGSYAISNRLKIRAGINRVNLNQTTADVFAFVGAQSSANGVMARMPNVDYKSNVASIALMSSEMMNRNSSPELFNTKIAGNLEQRFGFLEVPLELEYRLLDKKFGVNLVGGFSTFFLNENEIYADVNGSSTLIGEANNINSTSFSANLGLGVDYNLTQQWNINLEPMFKYQLNTFNNTSGDFRPFFIGVYTGLSFKF
ncbi:outer membrane protein [Winogradskyella aurantia]|uniref:Outer membrane protein beta-barrel domain-containing protein n=1 Tax=Winogradskyella aurantia TaxID=1915063 RepID=A0A265UZW9_9FLAO|nr:hypothetical protein [Winogradskyella aurantia]OZV70772.1 hypothetical protein CA834_01275 [Winogradskyella aurantia]